MKKIFQKAVIAVSIIAICVTKPAAQITFKAAWQGDSVIQVDNKISFKVEIKNNKRHKVILREPALGQQVYCFIREDSDSVWSGMSVETLSDAPFLIALPPKTSTEASFSIFPSRPLLPKKKYYMKVIYYPNETDNQCYDPNRAVKCPKALYKESDLVFFTDTLPQESLEEWLWLEKHKLREVYYINGLIKVNKDDFEQAEKFLELYPKSIFINAVKEMYIEFAAFHAPIKNISIEVIDMAIAFCHDIQRSGNFEHLSEGYLDLLLEEKEKVKH